MKRDPDDSPDPIGTTPKRLADELHSIGDQLMRLANRSRTFALFVPENCRDELARLYDGIRYSSRGRRLCRGDPDRRRRHHPRARPRRRPRRPAAARSNGRDSTTSEG